MVTYSAWNKALTVCGLIAVLGFSLQSGSARAVTRPAMHDGRHDFDFEIGTWTIRVRRRVHPLTGSDTWVSPRGYVHIVRKVWGGRASLAELEVEDPVPHFLGLMLRLYNPRSDEWSIYWGSAQDGTLDSPLIGRFQNGRGEFFNQEVVHNAIIRVRVVYSDITANSFRTEQSVSADGGRTWQPNLIQAFTRALPKN